jgi:hypothetical protein
MGQRDNGAAYFAALSGQQWDKVEDILADDFQWAVTTNVMANTISKQAYIASQKALFAGMPDYRVAWQPSREEGDSVYGVIRITGTHTNPISLMPGQPPLPPTGKHIVVEADSVVTWRGDKIATLTSRATTPSIGEQLGITPPA